MSQREVNVLHVIGSDTPLGRLETLRLLRARPAPGRQGVILFGERGVDCSGLGPVRWVRVPLAVDWLARLSLRDLLPTSRSTIVHVWSAAALPWVAHTADSRVLVEVETPQDLRRLARRLPEMLSSATIRFVCPSETTRRGLRACGVPPEACVLIRDAVDPSGIETVDRIELRRALNIGPADAAVLLLPPVRRATGGLVGAWGAMLLEHARPGVRLLLPSGGREAARVTRLVTSCRLQAILRAVGGRFRVSELLAASDLAVYLPTGAAPLRGVAQAMAAGRPIVASDVPVTRELLAHRETAWLCGAGDPQDACRWMLRALEAPEESGQQTRAAQAQANAAGDRRRLLDQYRQVYQALLADGRLGRDLGAVALVR
jgi:glycosyltransferase involved in cell wall biosynthesis